MLRSSASILGLAVLLAGCGDPHAGALFADIQYSTRCDNGGGCPGRADHDICGFNNSDPCESVPGTPVISCSVVETETTRTISFTARQGSGFSIGIANLQVPITGGSSTGGACRVTVSEGANSYRGGCGGSPPSEAQPCQITDVTFSDDMGNAELEGKIFCQELANVAQPSLSIEVTAIGAGPMSASSPGRFRISNCDGLTL